MAKSLRNPSPAYPAKDSAVLYGDKELYARIANTAEVKGQRKLVGEFEIPIRSGKAWVVKKGKYMFRLTTKLTLVLQAAKSYERYRELGVGCGLFETLSPILRSLESYLLLRVTR